MHGLSDRLVTVWIDSQMPDDVLRDDHGVVDHESDRDRHRSQRHQIECLADQVHRVDAYRERERNRRGTDRRDPRVVQEKKQDDHR